MEFVFSLTEGEYAAAIAAMQSEICMLYAEGDKSEFIWMAKKMAGFACAFERNCKKLENERETLLECTLSGDGLDMLLLALLHEITRLRDWDERKQTEMAMLAHSIVDAVFLRQ